MHSGAKVIQVRPRLPVRLLQEQGKHSNLRNGLDVQHQLNHYRIPTEGELEVKL